MDVLVLDPETMALEMLDDPEGVPRGSSLPLMAGLGVGELQSCGPAMGRAAGFSGLLVGSEGPSAGRFPVALALSSPRYVDPRRRDLGADVGSDVSGLYVSCCTGDADHRDWHDP